METLKQELLVARKAYEEYASQFADTPSARNFCRLFDAALRLQAAYGALDDARALRRED